MSRLVRYDSDAFRHSFNRQPFAFEHALCGDERFALALLAELASELPPASIEYNAGDVPVELDPAATPHNGLSPAETVHRIENCRSWMVLKNVEQVPEYGRLLDDCLAQLRGHAESLEPGLHDPEAFVFVSSPGSVTPFHIDPELNFLFQVRGWKTLRVFDPADREVVGETDLEAFFGGAHRNLHYDERWEERAMQLRLDPGTGVHVPVAAPHWVKNGDAVSVSFSVTFRSRQSKRRADVYQMNHRLRHLGLAPRPYGGGRLRDTVKQAANRIVKRAATLRRQSPFGRARA